MTVRQSDPLGPEKSEGQEDQEAEERFADESPADDPSPQLSDPDDSPEQPTTRP
jgi:hypothetical protein